MEVKPTTTRRPGRPRGDSAAVPEEKNILLRGMQAFAELGYDRASARELARRLGVSHTFINDRYGSKLDFWRAAVDAALGAQLERMTPVPPGLDDKDMVRWFITEFYRTNVDKPYLVWLIADEASRETERLDYLYERYVAPAFDLIMPSMERLMRSGHMARLPKDVLFFAVIGPVSGLVQEPMARRLGLPEHLTREARLARAEALAELVVGGLLSSSATNSGSGDVENVFNQSADHAPG